MKICLTISHHFSKLSLSLFLSLSLSFFLFLSLSLSLFLFFPFFLCLNGCRFHPFNNYEKNRRWVNRTLAIWPTRAKRIRSKLAVCYVTNPSSSAVCLQSIESWEKLVGLRVWPQRPEIICRKRQRFCWISIIYS